MRKITRRLAEIINGRRTSDGAGVALTRILSPAQIQSFDPFLLLDEFASDDAADYLAGFPDHPHRGFATVTYMLEGAMGHRDHLGNEGHLRAGGVQWMTAGRGIIHSEMPEQQNGRMHGFQLWVNLPAREKMGQPSYQEFQANQIPRIDLDGGASIHLIAGSFAGAAGEVLGPVVDVSSRPLYCDVSLPAGQALEIPVAEQATVFAYVYRGEIAVEGSARLHAGQLGRLIDGDRVRFASVQDSTGFLLVAAHPIKEPVAHSGPFVMNTVEEIEQAYRDLREGVFV